jgi:hypothetical protein
VAGGAPASARAPPPGGKRGPPPAAPRRPRIHEGHFSFTVERHDEHVGRFDERAVTAFELFALALQRDFGERLLDGRNELLGAKRFKQKGKSPRPERGDGGIDSGKPRDEDDFALRRGGAEGANEVDAARVGELHIDDRDVETLPRRRPYPRLPFRAASHLDLELARPLQDVRQVGREVQIIVDDQNARGHANYAHPK